ncbi:VOC family protein [Bacillus sp. ISL-47]|uniref:VOC family protein n=1 Tax=Bacillus sp. ISL-47 TaxID=2819130 RepID=UPI001BEB55A6|nr:VOC family protein [Bacillus sp. ISL-47]MBT2688498.1 VOC family protein [Bacillus sp. ISL-47]MBT2709039.1 VOC family protein [Pseudomonas sp. ISL-84]
MLNRLCVLTVKVNNLQTALKFYTEALDFKVSKYYGEKIVSLVHSEVPVVLEETAEENKGANVLPGILSEDIERDFSRMKEAGVNVLFDEPQSCPPGRYFVIEDPSGNQIEIVEFLNIQEK